MSVAKQLLDGEIKNYQNDGLIFFMYVENFAPIGVIALDKNNEIRCLLVDSEKRRRGIASKLISHVEEYAEKNGIKRLTATTLLENIQTQELFKKNGYKTLYKFQKDL